jgi:hypothetical protein
MEEQTGKATIAERAANARRHYEQVSLAAHCWLSTIPNAIDAWEREQIRLLRDCPTYSYWHDLKTDLRRPTSWLDLANMILRRFRLVLVRNVDDEGETASWRLRGWVGFLDEVHEQGRCDCVRKDS